MKSVLLLGLILGLAMSVEAAVQSQGSPKTVEQYKQLGKEVVPPKVTKHISPEYPEKLRKKKITGTVIISFVVDENGVPQQLEVRESSHPGFNSPALSAVSQWRFSPGQVDGRPTPMATSAEVSFRLY